LQGGDNRPKKVFCLTSPTLCPASCLTIPQTLLSTADEVIE
jgi:hypothetical protein